ELGDSILALYSSSVLVWMQSRPLIMLEVGRIANLALQGGMGERVKCLQFHRVDFDFPGVDLDFPGVDFC
nr:hypothetical protein [Tanacetum cinerariifolium]